VSWWVLAPLAVLGAIRGSPPARWVLLAPAVGVAITTVLFYGGHRIRSPLEPVIAVLAGIAVASLLGRADSGTAVDELDGEHAEAVAT
jgi:hypothetical protein